MGVSLSLKVIKTKLFSRLEHAFFKGNVRIPVDCNRVGALMHDLLSEILWVYIIQQIRRDNHNVPFQP